MFRTYIAFLAVLGLLSTGCAMSTGGNDNSNSDAAGGSSGTGGDAQGGTMPSDPDPMGGAVVPPMGGTAEPPMGGTPDPGPGDGAVEISDVLTRLANDLVLPTFVQFAEKSAALETSVGEWAASPTNSELREAAREAWVEATFTWQHAELMQLGPVGASGKRLAGDDLRDRIYSWPATRTCRIDQTLLSAEFNEADWLDGALFEVQGLDALEYVLYSETLENACPGAVRINRDGLWASEFPDLDSLTARRAEFAAVVAGGVRVAADEVVTAFSADGGNFAGALAAGTAPYADAKNGLNEVYAALFYVDKLIKDAKLGRPLGIAEGCDEDRCPEAFESRYSGRGAAHLLANLDSFEAMFFGTIDGEEGPGFDDLLQNNDGAVVVSRMAENIAAARSAIEALGNDLPTALTDNASGVEAAHSAIKSVTDDFKGGVVTILDLEVPREGSGDSD